MCKVMLLVAMLLALCVGGCGVILNSEYSQLLDQTATLSDSFADRLEAGEFDGCDPCDMAMITRISRQQAISWQRFQDARDGVSEGGE